MGRIVTSVRITNVRDPAKSLECDALVDSGATFMVLPTAWRDRLGDLDVLEEVELETANQTTVTGQICGPVTVQLEGFRPVYTEVVFVEMQPEEGVYEPLIGYTVLELARAAIDMVGHRLTHAKHADLK